MSWQQHVSSRGKNWSRVAVITTTVYPHHTLHLVMSIHTLHRDISWQYLTFWLKLILTITNSHRRIILFLTRSLLISSAEVRTVCDMSCDRTRSDMNSLQLTQKHSVSLETWMMRPCHRSITFPDCFSETNSRNLYIYIIYLNTLYFRDQIVPIQFHYLDFMISISFVAQATWQDISFMVTSSKASVF